MDLKAQTAIADNSSLCSLIWFILLSNLAAQTVNFTPKWTKIQMYFSPSDDFGKTIARMCQNGQTSPRF
ncbi:hypothetical protein B0189_06195 [Moraxella cuniculi]|nr:hypothetical protein B0189_06195 [Moraxella cuniculi]